MISRTFVMAISFGCLDVGFTVVRWSGSGRGSAGQAAATLEH
jgi:hypothetical protein